MHGAATGKKIKRDHSSIDALTWSIANDFKLRLFMISERKTTFGGLSRSELMSRIKGRGNVSTEKRLLQLLRWEHLSGWRRHLPLPGRPDFAWRKQKVAVFVDGCFWHGHNCDKNLTPRSNVDVWKKKLNGNKRRDKRVNKELRARGWRVLRIFECDLSKRPDACLRRIRQLLESSR